MPPIRKGDATPVAPKGISQVRTGDGRILFDRDVITDSVIEDFEWGGNLQDRYGGTLGGATLANDSSLEGNFLLDADGDECTIWNTHHSLPQTEQQRFYSAWQKVDTGGDGERSTILHHVDEDGLDCYGFSASPRDDHVAIRKQNGGSTHIDRSDDWDEFEFVSESFSVSEFGTLVFGQNDDDLMFDYYDDDLIEPEDLVNSTPDVSLVASGETDFTSGRIGFSTTHDRESLFDYYVDLGNMDSPP